MDDLQVLIEVIKGCTIELLVVVGDNHLRQAKLTNIGLLDETTSFIFSDPG